MPAPTKTTWLQYIHDLAHREYDFPLGDTDNVSDVIAYPSNFQNFFQHSIPAIYLLDYRTRMYRSVSEGMVNVLGFSSRDLETVGLDLTLENYCAQDLALYDKQIFPDRLEILKAIPPECHKDYVFTYTFRFTGAHGQTIHIMQRNCFIRSDKNGTPLVSLGMVANVTHHLDPNMVKQTVEKMATPQTPGELMFSKNYFLSEEARVFSRREQDILKYTTEGCTYKEIAAKLFIAEGTVIQHRKNMLQKSNTKNVAELVAFAIRNNLI